MKTIVTGGAGFIGSHLVKKLIEDGREVVVIDDLSSGSLENLLSLGLKRSVFEFKKLDLTDYHQTSDALKEGDIVFHLAARIGGIKFLYGSESAELLALQENLAIDSNVFRACLEKKIKKLFILPARLFTLWISSILLVPFFLKRIYPWNQKYKTPNLNLKFQLIRMAAMD